MILCPDGDVWTSTNLLSRFCSKFSMSSGVIVTGVERLPHDKDPDEVHPEDREVISYGDMVKALKKLEESDAW